MQKRAGILFISQQSSRVLLLWQDSKWTVPTFIRSSTVIDDSKGLIDSYRIAESKLIPIELYTSQDNGFEYSTYICLVNNDFIPDNETYSWASMNNLPKNIHTGLKSTMTNKITQAKIDTILLMGRTYE